MDGGQTRLVWASGLRRARVTNCHVVRIVVFDIKMDRRTWRRVYKNTFKVIQRVWVITMGVAVVLLMLL